MNNLKELKPRKALNKAFLKVKPNRTEIEGFKTNLITLLDRTNDTESEEFHKNLVIDFLKKTYYDPNHFINTKGRNDLVIHNGPNANSTVGVILEAKKPTNKSEMITNKKLNAKAFQELVLYYLRERITHKNLEVKHLVATNINEWFIFDATLFDRLFAQNKNLVKQFNDFEAGRLSDTKTDFFYKQVAEPFIDSITSEIEFTYFNIQDFQKPLRNTDKADDNSLIALFKLLSPEHLLKLPFTNDSNSLDKRFYSELLHIIGLTETKEGSKKLIERNKEGERHTGTILEDAIIQLDSLDKLSRLEKPNQFGNTQQERLFNVALELSITWINRILFLKLLEAQLITYHKSPLSRGAGGVSPLSRGAGGLSEYKFLNLDKIKNYDDLNSLFFQVLARKYDERNDDVKKAFEKVPYLNSSLFEPTELEQLTLFISNLKDDKTIPIFSQTVLKDQQGKKRTGNISTLQYLFEFLDAYDFGAEGGEEIQEDNKTLINASVLGLIFEKINGYKDGSFFTPGFITMYMCRETIRKAVVQKFNEAAKKSPLERGFRGVSSLLEEGKGGVRRQIIPYNPKLKELARELRNNSTKSEIILWKELKGKFEDKYDFHRQKPLDNYIADFFCHELKLVIEIDGETHNWEETQQKDFQKEKRLNELGLNVLRFPDTDIFKHLEATLETIRQYITGFEKGDLSELNYEDSPLNPFSGNVGIVETHPQPLSRGEFRSLNDVYEQIGEDRLFTREQANQIVNSIKICDPAVGSGHFLVSALNEMIAVKNDLKILQDREGKRLKEYQVEVVNDELIVTDEEGELFEYTPPSPLERGERGVSESQRIQETLFHEKQTIIENCLFGVDINSNSVKICRLRLWIELLKNAYYKQLPDSPQGEDSPLSRGVGGVTTLSRGVGGVLETLPNIDINIKCGNSLVSRFAIDADLKPALRKSKWTIDSYRIAVDTYRNAESKEQKREMERLIADIKSDFRSEIDKSLKQSLRNTRGAADILATKILNLKTFNQKADKKLLADHKKAVEKLNKLEAQRDETLSNQIYENAFEWRFEFPEVLNDDGDFVGFDVVIGNPPYGIDFSEREKEFLKAEFDFLVERIRNSFLYFIGQGLRLTRQNGILNYIVPNEIMFQIYMTKARKYFLTEKKVLSAVNLGDNVFEDAVVSSAILEIQNKAEEKYSVLMADIREKIKDRYVNPNDLVKVSSESLKANFNQIYVVGSEKSNLVNKLMTAFPTLESISITVANGISTSCDKVYIVNGNTINLNKIEKSVAKRTIRGSNFNKYFIDNNVDDYVVYITKDTVIEEVPNTIAYLEPNKDLLIKSSVEKKQGKRDWHILFRPREESDFATPKILVRQTADRIIAAFDSEIGFYPIDTVNVVKLESEDIEFNLAVLGVLNSKLITFFYQEISQEGGRILAQVKPSRVKAVPIPNFKNTKSLSKLVQNVIDKKKENKDTADLENQIDQLVYQLYGLTDDEIKIVEGK